MARVIVVMGGLLLFVALGCFLPQSSYKNEWQIFKRPEQTTEFYFAPHVALPKKYTPGRSQSIEVVIHNNESSTLTYPYEVTQEKANHHLVVLKTGAITVREGETVTTEIPITYVEGGARSRITIQLKDRTLNLHYWVERR